MRNCIPVLFAVALIFSLTACQSREPITADTFREKVEALTYTPVDITDQFTDYPQIVTAVGIDKDGLRVEFYELDGADNATAFFNGNQAQVELKQGSTSASTSVSTSSYQKYTLKTSETYYLLERVETTVIYSYCDSADTATLDNLITELGY